MVTLLSLDLQRLHQRHLLLCRKFSAVQLLTDLFSLLPEALGILLCAGLSPAHLSHAQLEALGLRAHLQLSLPLGFQSPLETLCLLYQLLGHLLLILLQPSGLLLGQLLLLLQQLCLSLQPRGFLHRLHLLLQHLLCQGPLLRQVLLCQLPQPRCLLGSHAQPCRFLGYLLHLLGLLLQEALCVVLVTKDEGPVFGFDASLKLAQLLHLHTDGEELLLYLATLPGCLCHLGL